MDAALNERTLTTEMVKSVGSCDRRGWGEPVGQHLQGHQGREKPGGCPIKTDSGQVIGPDRSATLLAETFFPDDRVDTDDPYHTEAPGIDGFTSDICQAAIFRDLGLFLAMANKCLELGYFPSLEGGGNQVIRSRVRGLSLTVL
ncbi:hypothetical protein EVAR_91925_1 [Eumeta japonica]|uniref:Uncharacterized protein n=1 Tax=Eumeta variegata TaxID=151549 RepID=A0A4C1SXI9_EUMVA|nr:hypothetical protein EVAR_91925_1 [Eumeta japonica]